MTAGLDHGNTVEGSVELPVPAPVEAVGAVVAGTAGGGDGAVPLCRAKAAGLRNRRMSSASPRILAAVITAAPGWPAVRGPGR